MTAATLDELVDATSGMDLAGFLALDIYQRQGVQESCYRANKASITQILATHLLPADKPGQKPKAAEWVAVRGNTIIAWGSNTPDYDQIMAKEYLRKPADRKPVFFLMQDGPLYNPLIWGIDQIGP